MRPLVASPVLVQRSNLMKLNSCSLGYKVTQNWCRNFASAALALCVTCSRIHYYDKIDIFRLHYTCARSDKTYRQLFISGTDAEERKYLTAQLSVLQFLFTAIK